MFAAFKALFFGAGGNATAITETDTETDFGARKGAMLEKMSWAAAFVFAAAIASCDASKVSAAPTAQKGAPEMTLELKSKAFDHKGSIPSLYTCQGKDLSPPLEWKGAPAGTKSFALIVDDPDAPDPKAPKMTWVHWVLYDISTETANLPEAVSTLPLGAREGQNDWKRTSYGGPCPPIGRHRYFHKLYALDTMLGDLAKPTKNTLEQAMKGHVLAEAQLVGTYEKQK